METAQQFEDFWQQALEIPDYGIAEALAWAHIRHDKVIGAREGSERAALSNVAFLLLLDFHHRGAGQLLSAYVEEKISLFTPLHQVSLHLDVAAINASDESLIVAASIVRAGAELGMICRGFFLLSIADGNAWSIEREAQIEELRTVVDGLTDEVLGSIPGLGDIIGFVRLFATVLDTIFRQQTALQRVRDQMEEKHAMAKTFVEGYIALCYFWLNWATQLNGANVSAYVTLADMMAIE